MNPTSTHHAAPGTPPQSWRIGLAGYGEVGRILAEDLRAQGVAVVAIDLKLLQPDLAQPLQAHAANVGVQLAASQRMVNANGSAESITGGHVRRLGTGLDSRRWS